MGTLQVCVVAAAAAAGGEREDCSEPARAPYQRPFTCVRLQGLPYDVEMEEVVELLVRSCPCEHLCSSSSSSNSSTLYSVAAGLLQTHSNLHSLHMTSKAKQPFPELLQCMASLPARLLLIGGHNTYLSGFLISLMDDTRHRHHHGWHCDAVMWRRVQSRWTTSV
jgi:hypothetical protein